MIEPPTGRPAPAAGADRAERNDPAERTDTAGRSRRRDEPADPARDPLHDVVGRVREITRANEHLFARLIEGERRFRGLAKAVWKVQEDERRRLARELHDGLGQTLTALTHQLERLRERPRPELPTRPGIADIAARLADSVEMARLALNETRELSRLLRPPVLDDLGLAPALSWLARTLEQRTGLKVELTVEIGPEIAGEAAAGASTRTSRPWSSGSSRRPSPTSSGTPGSTARRWPCGGPARRSSCGWPTAGGASIPPPCCSAAPRAPACAACATGWSCSAAAWTITSAPGQGTVISARVPLAAAQTRTADA